MLKIILSFITCAISFPKKIIDRDWPTISTEEATEPGGLIHRMNSYWVTTVRHNANFFAKAFAFSNLLLIATLILSWLFA